MRTLDKSLLARAQWFISTRTLDDDKADVDWFSMQISCACKILMMLALHTHKSSNSQDAHNFSISTPLVVVVESMLLLLFGWNFHCSWLWSLSNVILLAWVEWLILSRARWLLTTWAQWFMLLTTSAAYKLLCFSLSNNSHNTKKKQEARRRSKEFWWAWFCFVRKFECANSTQHTQLTAHTFNRWARAH